VTAYDKEALRARARQAWLERALAAVGGTPEDLRRAREALAFRDAIADALRGVVPS